MALMFTRCIGMNVYLLEYAYIAALWMKFDWIVNAWFWQICGSVYWLMISCIETWFLSLQFWHHIMPCFMIFTCAMLVHEWIFCQRTVSVLSCFDVCHECELRVDWLFLVQVETCSRPRPAYATAYHTLDVTFLMLDYFLTMPYLFVKCKDLG